MLRNQHYIGLKQRPESGNSGLGRGRFGVRGNVESLLKRQEQATKAKTKEFKKTPFYQKSDQFRRDTIQTVEKEVYRSFVDDGIENEQILQNSICLSLIYNLEFRYMPEWDFIDQNKHKNLTHAHIGNPIKEFKSLRKLKMYLESFSSYQNIAIFKRDNNEYEIYAIKNGQQYKELSEAIIARFLKCNFIKYKEIKMTN